MTVKQERAFDPTSMCVMEMFDTATFAQVPLELSGTLATGASATVRSGGARAAND